VLNAQGLDRAVACGMRHLSLSVSLSETHSRTNAGCGADEALAAMTTLVRQAVDRGIAVRAGMQCAFGCAEEGRIPEERVVAAARQLMAAGAIELNLADTAGLAQPLQVGQLVAQVRETLPAATLSLHLHDTGGLGLANMQAGYEAGVRLFDVCVGGLGGCPFVRGAVGNVAAEEAVRLFAGMGVATGIDLPQLLKATAHYEALLGRNLPDASERGLAPTSC
jgi:hydroxymethylglutaryl-CoA lyase